MRDLFFAMYKSGFEWTIWGLLFLLIGVVVLIISFAKLKKKTRIAGIIISLLLIWQIVPVGFYWIALASGTGMSPSKLISIYKQDKYSFYYTHSYINNYYSYIKYMKFAADTSMIPWQKGAYYYYAANECWWRKQGPKALEYYGKAYKYIKSYIYPDIWSLGAAFAYEVSGDIDTAIKITTETRVYPLTTTFYIIKDDLESAMEFANKTIEHEEFGSNGYRLRAYINYRLNNREAELADYQKALAMVKNEKYKSSVEEYRQIREKMLELQKLNAERWGFTKE